jgi:hypothetical protein
MPKRGLRVARLPATMPKPGSMVDHMARSVVDPKEMLIEALKCGGGSGWELQRKSVVLENCLMYCIRTSVDTLALKSKLHQQSISHEQMVMRTSKRN